MKSSFSLYPKNQMPFDPAVFAHPSSEYRGAPFWSWNNRLNRDQLRRQIDVFKQMGMGGFHIHSRTGLDTEYMGQEFMDIVRDCADYAEAKGMLTWLYDEDRWPSGYGGGMVTSDPRFRGMRLRFTQSRREREGSRELLASYEVVLKDGRLAHYRRLAAGEEPSEGGTVWDAWVETVHSRNWYNYQTYVDTLNKAAIERFIETTHEVYARVLGERFGKSVPAIFTDEPQFSVETYALPSPLDSQDVFIPFTRDLPTTYEAAFHEKLDDFLPELIWDLPGEGVSTARYHYLDHITERFASAFADTLGEWCERHGLALTGHSHEDTLQGQTTGCGEAMRGYRAFQLPGIDLLGDHRDYQSAKQAQSACHQYGRSGVMSELYGVTGWHFDFVGHKEQGDWQAALGITVRVHHLAMVSMAGEAKRDYPASIGYQSPWFGEYPIVEDHFARLNTVLSRGRPGMRVAVIHPIESFWLCYAPLGRRIVEREEREKLFKELSERLLFGLIDFDFISEGLLPSQGPRVREKQLQVGEMSYEAVVVPSLRTIRSTTLKVLEEFAQAGGRVIFVGEIPGLVDARPSGRARHLAEKCAGIALTCGQALEALEGSRDVSVRLANDRPADSVLHQIRIEGGGRYVFFCNTDRIRAREGVTIRLRGECKVVRLDTLTGGREWLASRLEEGWTVLNWNFSACGSLLLSLEPGWQAGERPYVRENIAGTASPMGDPLPITLSEPNVLMLDQAQWRLDGERGDWRPAEEILRLDNLVRRALGLPDRTGEDAQPWANQSPAPVLAQLELRFFIESEVAVVNPLLALEHPSAARVFFNGVEVPAKPTGWWVDEAIETLRLPDFGPGRHELVVSLPFSRRTELESCYLLGDFGVVLLGRRARLSEPVRALAFGDWTRQGLPFYAGNVTYHHSWTAGADGRWSLRIPKFGGPVISVGLDEKRVGAIAFPPFEIDLGRLAAGAHTLEITVYGDRENSFGPLHRCKEAKCAGWVDAGTSPAAYRMKGDLWCYEYQVKPMGIITAPVLKRT